MAHHIDKEGRFQSDKYPDLPPDKIVISFKDPRALRGLRVIAEDYLDTDPELTADITERLKTIQMPGRGRANGVKPQTVYRIIDRATGEAVGSYSRACRDEYDFHSEEAARNANVHGMFKDENKYRIEKYRVTYELIP